MQPKTTEYVMKSDPSWYMYFCALWFHILHVVFLHYFIQQFPFLSNMKSLRCLEKKQNKKKRKTNKKNPGGKFCFMHYLSCELLMKRCFFLCWVDCWHHIAYLMTGSLCTLSTNSYRFFNVALTLKIPSTRGIKAGITTCLCLTWFMQKNAELKHSIP